MNETKSCTCWRCSQPCQIVPGWFKPGEAEKAAALLGLPLRKFFKKYLGVTFRSRNPDVFALAPAIRSMKAGQEYPPDPRGTCVFFTKDGRCAIHAAKPYECAVYYHDETEDGANKIKDELIASWEDQQAQIQTLLGRKHPRALDAVRDQNGNIVAIFDHSKESADAVLARLANDDRRTGRT